MKYVVAYKWAPDPQNARVAQDGTIDWGRKLGLSEYDPVAFRVARELADKTGAEVVGVTVGSPESASGKATQAAAARGADRLIVVSDEKLAEAPSIVTARVLAQTVTDLGDVALVLTGDGSSDGSSKTFPGLVAAYLNTIVLSDVRTVEADGDGFTVTRDSDGGSQQVSVPSPSVLSVASDAVAVPIPGMKDLMAAKKKPVEIKDASGLDNSQLSTVQVTGRSKPEARARKNQIFEGADAASQLVSALRTDGIL